MSKKHDSDIFGVSLKTSTRVRPIVLTSPSGETTDMSIRDAYALAQALEKAASGAQGGGQFSR